MFTTHAYAHRPGMAASLNDWTLDFAASTPECLPGATFFPEPGAADYVTGALDRGARIFKLHLQVGGFDPRAAELDAVWALLAETGTPIVVHAGSGPVAGGFTGPGPIGDVLARHPRLAILIAHLGAPEYEDFLDLAARHERVGLDTTMALTGFFEEFRPFPPALLPAAARPGPGRQGPARQRLPDHPLPVRPPARGPGPRRSGRRLAAGGLLAERRDPLRPERLTRHRRRYPGDHGRRVRPSMRQLEQGGAPP